MIKLIMGMFKMALILRRGIFGEYWGDESTSSHALDLDKMKVNAEYIYKSLGDKGFTKNAICGMLGNMQSESTINPGRWQSDSVGGDPEGHGYGLVQWTPYTKYTLWCSGDYSTMDNNLYRVIYEIDNGIQWIQTQSYPITFYEFAHSKESPEYLAQAFLRNYERPQDPDQPIRSTQARYWWDYLVDNVRVKNTKKWLYSRCFVINLRR